MEGGTMYEIARAVITLDEVAVMHRLTRAQRAT
jgi:hypothetical protein